MYLELIVLAVRGLVRILKNDCKIYLFALRPFIPNILSPGSTGILTGGGGGGGGALRGQSGQPSSGNG